MALAAPVLVGIMFNAAARARRAELTASPDYVEQVLRDGAERARAVASKVLARTRKACGLAG